MSFWPKRHTPRSAPPAPENVTDIGEARLARRQAELDLQAARAHDEQVRTLAARLRDARVQNHFVQALEIAVHRKD